MGESRNSHDDRSATICDGSPECEAVLHIHGCFADTGNCDEPDEYHVPFAHEPAGETRLTPDEGVERA